MKKFQNIICSTGSKWSSLNATTTKYLVSCTFQVKMKVKSWKSFRTTFAQQASDDLVWMPQPLNILYLAHLKCYESQKLKKFQNIIWSTGSKWSSLNATTTKYLVSCTFQVKMKVKSWKSFRTLFAQQAQNDLVWMPQPQNLLWIAHLRWNWKSKVEKVSEQYLLNCLQMD